MDWLEIVGYGGTAATILSYSMRTIVPLRIAGIASSFFFIAYAAILGVWPMLITELVILPLNTLRLYQILKLINQTKDAPDGVFLAEWLDPFASRRRHQPGEIVFRQGDAADYLLLIHSGRYHLVEGGFDVLPGNITGEVGFVAHHHRRAMTLMCVEAGTAGQVSYSDIKQLFFQNPRFAYFFLQLVGSRIADRLADVRDELEEIKTHAAADAPGAKAAE